MSRETILGKIRANKPASASTLPVIPGFSDAAVDLTGLFKTSLENNKAAVMEVDAAVDLAKVILSQYPDVEKIVSTIPSVKGTVENAAAIMPHELNLLDLAIVKGELGVADTGAIWVSDKTLPLRVLPFIARYLVIVVDAGDLVHKMHQAYARLLPREVGYGVFISGPSKTGDIEQALVIGAQGPLGLTVVIRK